MQTPHFQSYRRGLSEPLKISASDDSNLARQTYHHAPTIDSLHTTSHSSPATYPTTPCAVIRTPDNGDNLEHILFLARHIYSTMSHSFQIIDNALIGLEIARMALDDLKIPSAASPQHPTPHPITTFEIDMIEIPTLLPATPPTHTPVPRCKEFSPVASCSIQAIIISDYEPNALHCWDYGAINEWRQAIRGGVDGKNVRLWRNWSPGGVVKCERCPGDGDDRGAFGHIEGDGQNKEIDDESSDYDEADNDDDADMIVFSYSDDEADNDDGADMIFFSYSDDEGHDSDSSFELESDSDSDSDNSDDEDDSDNSDDEDDSSNGSDDEDENEDEENHVKIIFG
ncbi:hypothetical protein FN846DRAFT_415135 [Sphaerosporella brunnea]|uniref:Uncharacterized protein n=1 Tax=Sphaerosporella brunnea TaxID=1250544 RepID=A0A5J5F4V8_9PEZI|nr:hypothetical protein FN846DRAFT_415135 [Sphaerosporella brunnea]